MWNFTGVRCSTFMAATPSATCTNMASSAIAVNHHRALLRSHGQRCAANAHPPAMPLAMITSQAPATWRSRNGTAPHVRGSSQRGDVVDEGGGDRPREAAGLAEL